MEGDAGYLFAVAVQQVVDRRLRRRGGLHRDDFLFRKHVFQQNEGQRQDRDGRGGDDDATDILGHYRCLLLDQIRMPAARISRGMAMTTT